MFAFMWSRLAERDFFVLQETKDRELLRHAVTLCPARYKILMARVIAGKQHLLVKDLYVEIMGVSPLHYGRADIAREVLRHATRRPENRLLDAAQIRGSSDERLIDRL